MTKKCIICGAEFEPRYNLHKTQKCCSRECGKELRRKNQREFYRNNTEYYKQKSHAYRLKKFADSTLCRLCGEPTTPSAATGYKPHYHEECIIEDCLDALRQGRRLTGAQYQRANQRGLTLKELHEILAERDEA
jgi:hypothetical protein